MNFFDFFLQRQQNRNQIINSTLVIKFNDIVELYKEADKLEEYGNSEMYKKFSEIDNPEFVGLPIKDILESKFSYKKGLTELEKVNKLDFELGGQSIKYKWDFEDGDDMNMERFYDGNAFLHKRKKRIGNNNGKFISFNIDICVNAWVTPEQMLYKSYTCIKLLDYLESLNYKVEVIVHDITRFPGSYKGKSVGLLKTMCTLKSFDEPLQKSLLLTCISPWFFRYWLFRLHAAKLFTNPGLGQAAHVYEPSTPSNIWINSQECLDLDSAQNKIKQIQSLFENNE